MDWFRKKPVTTDQAGTGSGSAKAPPPVLAPSEGSTKAPERTEPRLTDPGRLPPGGMPVQVGSVRPLVKPEEPAHFTTYADVPRFVRLLSKGEKAVVNLRPDERQKLIVVELVGRVALIAHADAPAMLLETVKGKLREANYQIRTATAELGVVTAMYVAGETTETSHSPGARSSNPYMQAVDEWVSYAVANNATDIHLEIRGTAATVRFRVDGEMELMRGDSGGRYPAAFVDKCIHSLYNLEQQSKSGSESMFDSEKFLYCMVPYHNIPGHSLKLRFQSLKGNEGPKAVLRLLHVDENQPTQTFEQLGYSPSQIRMWEAAQQTPSGAVLIAGVTGSGKSTTQKSFIELNPLTPISNVLTAEDPVEYPIAGAHQVPIQRDVSDDEGSGARYREAISSFMRADPDVLMLGEIRDRWSARAMQQFVETGHMALGTVHAHLLPGIVPRLVNEEIGMSRTVLTAPNILTLLAYQALVPILCPECALPSSVASRTDRTVNDIVGHVSQMSLDTTPLRWKRVGGCSHCNFRGTKGLTVVAEMLMPDDDWLNCIREERDSAAMDVYRRTSDGNLMSDDMTGKSVFEHTLHKALHGLVDARQCSRFDLWPRFMYRLREQKRNARSAA